MAKRKFVRPYDFVWRYNMENDIFEVIENALKKAGYKILDGDADTVFIRHANSDSDYQIKITEVAA